MCFIFTIMINDRTKEKDSGVVNQKELKLIEYHFVELFHSIHNNAT